MKSYLYILLLLLLFIGCKQDISLYNGDSSIYFSDNNYDDTIRVNWGSVDTKTLETELILRVGIFGKITKHKRKFSIEIYNKQTCKDSCAVENVDYQPIATEYEVKTNVSYVDIKIVLLRSDILKNHDRYFGIRLIPNQDFSFNFMRYKTIGGEETDIMLDDHRIIYMDDKFPEPWWWKRIGIAIFGEWSVKKGILICDIGKIKREKFQGELTGQDGAITEA